MLNAAKKNNLFKQEGPNLINLGLNLIVFAALTFLRYSIANSSAAINVFYSAYSIVSVFASCFWALSSKRLDSKLFFAGFIVPFILPISFFLIQSCGYYYNHFDVSTDLIFYFNFVYCFLFLTLSSLLMTFVFSKRFKLNLKKKKSALIVSTFLILGVVSYLFLLIISFLDCYHIAGLVLSVISLLSILGFSYFSFDREENKISNAVNLFALGFGVCSILYLVYRLITKYLNMELGVDISVLSSAMLHLFVGVYVFPYVQLVYFACYLFNCFANKTLSETDEQNGSIKTNFKKIRVFLFIILVTALVFAILVAIRYITPGEETDNVTGIILAAVSYLAIAGIYVYIYFNKATRNKERLVAFLIPFASIFILLTAFRGLFNIQSAMYYNAVYLLVFEFLVTVLCFINMKDEKEVSLKVSFIGTSLSFVLEIAFVCVMVWCLSNNNFLGSGLGNDDAYESVSVMIMSFIGSLVSASSYFYFSSRLNESRTFKTFTYFLFALALCALGSFMAEFSLIAFSVERSVGEMFSLITFDPLLGIAVVPIAQICIFIYMFRRFLKRERV